MPLAKIEKHVTVTVTGNHKGRELAAPKTIVFAAWEEGEYVPHPAELYARAALWLQENIHDYTTILATNFHYDVEDGMHMSLMLVVE